MRGSSIAIVSLLLAAAAVLLGCLLPARAAVWSLAGGAAVLPVALIALGAGTGERSTARVRFVLAVLALLLSGTLATLILFHRAGLTGGLALQLAGIWLLPSLLTGIGYAVAFSGDRPRRGDRPGRET